VGMPVVAAEGSGGVEQILSILQVENWISRAGGIVPGWQVHDQVARSG
jgi:hypothetical protein